MRMAVDDVLDRNVEALRELRFQPRGHLRIDWLDEHNPVPRDHEHRHVVVHARVGGGAGPLANLLALVLRLLIAGPRLCRGDAGECDRAGTREEANHQFAHSVNYNVVKSLPDTTPSYHPYRPSRHTASAWRSPRG